MIKIDKKIIDIFLLQYVARGITTVLELKSCWPLFYMCILLVVIANKGLGAGKLYMAHEHLTLGLFPKRAGFTKYLRSNNWIFVRMDF